MRLTSFKCAPGWSAPVFGMARIIVGRPCAFGGWGSANGMVQFGGQLVSFRLPLTPLTQLVAHLPCKHSTLITVCFCGYRSLLRGSGVTDLVAHWCTILLSVVFD